MPQNYKKAIKYYMLVADQAQSSNQADAQKNLGSMYHLGHGAPQDFAKARGYYKLAADQGIASAHLNLGGMYMHGEGGVQDDTLAVLHFQAAADQGHAGAYCNLGMMYTHGRGVPQDDSKAAMHLQTAVDQGYTSAYGDLGAMFMQGRGVPRDYPKAAMLFQTAADQGDARAQKYLKQCLVHVQYEEEMFEDDELDEVSVSGGGSAGAGSGGGGRASAAETPKSKKTAKKKRQKEKKHAAAALGGKKQSCSQCMLVEIEVRGPDDSDHDATHDTYFCHGCGAMYCDACADKIDEGKLENCKLVNCNEPFGNDSYERLLILIEKKPVGMHPRATRGAQTTLGNLTFFGNGVPEDTVAAVKWFRLGSAAGCVVAKYMLGMLFKSSKLDPIKPKSKAERKQWETWATFGSGFEGNVRSNGLRFLIGSKVTCNVGTWSAGTIIALFPPEETSDWTGRQPGQVAAYQARLDDGRLIFVPCDTDGYVQKRA